MLRLLQLMVLKNERAKNSKPTLAKLAYLPRVIGCVLMAIMLLGTLQEQLTVTVSICITLNCIVWPHLARAHSMLAKNQRTAEYINQYLDAFFYGLWCAFVGFQVWVVFSLLIVTSINGLVSGGVKKYFTSNCTLIIGCLIGGSTFGFSFVSESPLTTKVVAALSVYLYCCNIAFFNRKYAGQLKASKDKVQFQNEALIEAKSKAEESSKSKSEFLANMSHEIRTPMNGILGTLQLLEQGDLNSEAKRLTSKATYSAKSLLTVINDILDFSKIEENKLTLEVTPFSMVEVIESVRSDVGVICAKKPIAINFVVQESFNPAWLGDSVRVRQVLLNLVSNAAKFTSKGSIDIKVGTVLHHSENALYFEVNDTGIGMSPEIQQSIFKRFHQADSSTTRKFGGTGLGLAITANLIRLMDGELVLQSEEGKGTSIKVTLPLKQTNLSAAEKKDKELKIPDLKNKKILVAEDNEINQLIIKAMLEKTSAYIHMVENGIQAVNSVKAGSYDLVFMDIHMPEMDGIEAFLTINKLYPELPIIALTANVMAQDIQRYKDLGFASHIGKPVDLADLHKVIIQVLNTNYDLTVR